MSKLHEVDENVVKTWLSYKDGRLLGNTRRRVRGAGDADEVARLEGHCRSHLLFTRAIFAIEYRREGQTRDDGVGDSGDKAESQLQPHDPPDTARSVEGAADGVADDDVAASKTKLNAPGPACIARLSNLLEALPATISRSLREADRGAGAVCEVPEPEVALSSEAQDWVYVRDDAFRHLWPLKPKAIDLSEFHEYITETVGLEMRTANGHVQRATYFLSLFDFPGDANLMGILAALYRTNIMSRAAKLPILHPERPMTKEVLVSVMHLVEFARLTCNQMDWPRALGNIEKLSAVFLEPLKARAQKGSKASHERWGEFEAARVANLPPAEINRAGVTSAMIDLQILWEHVKGSGGAASIQARRAANVIMMGLTYCNSFAGRPGEWETLRRDSVEQLIAAGTSTLIMKKHKTAHKHGKLGRHVPPGNLVAMGKCLDIFPPDSAYFFDPAAVGGKGASVRADNLLRKYGRTYTPDYEHPGPTLSRKFFATEADDETDLAKAKAVVAECNAHLGSTADASYVVPKAERVAARSAATFRTYKGEPAPWPSGEEVNARREESRQRVLKAFRHSFGDKAIPGGRRTARVDEVAEGGRAPTGAAEGSKSQKRYMGDENARHDIKKKRKGAFGPLPMLFATQRAGLRAGSGTFPA